MQPYPHTYVAAASARSQGLVSIDAPGLPGIETAAPPEFDGPGGVWSPEALLCAAIADCFVLTFRAVSRGAQLPWSRLECRVEGVLERVDRQSQFTRFRTSANLTVPEGVDVAAAEKLLEKAEKACLVTNSLRGSRTLEARVSTSASM
jgi:organic hydroperoxide reductase OsmC/OhrA